MPGVLGYLLPSEGAALLLGFALGVLVGAALCIFWLRAARRRADAALETVQKDLNRQVEARTAELAGLTARLQDEIADRTMVSQHLRQVHEIHRAIIEASPLAIFSLDRDRRITSWNPAAERIYGYSSAEVLGREFPSPAGAQHEAEERKRHHSNVIAGQIVRNVTVKRRRKDGTLMDILFSANPLYDDKGAIRGLVVVSEDVTATRLLAEEHRQSDHLRAQIVQTSDDAIISKNLDGIVTSWNSAAERIFGYPADQAIGRHIFLIFPPDLEAEEGAIMEQLRRGEDVQHYETVRRHKDGHDINVSLSVAPIRDAEGNITGVSKIARDITQQKKDQARALELQNELAHVARVSAMGQMSAAIAHELNQPLTAVANYVKAAQRHLAADPLTPRQIETAREVMEKAAGQTIRAGSIIRALRTFVEKRESEKGPADINEIIHASLALAFVQSADSNVRIALELEPDLPPVELDKVQIQQVLTNLIRNAVEAMAGSATRQLTLSSSRDGADQVLITVRDTGPGLAPEIAAKLFQPFMTTKSNGMGVGLAICQSIIEGHGGTIALAPGRPGARFEIRLPLQQPDEEVL